MEKETGESRNLFLSFQLALRHNSVLYQLAGVAALLRGLFIASAAADAAAAE